MSEATVETRRVFLLGRESWPGRDGWDVRWWGRAEDGPVMLRLPPQEAVFFVPRGVATEAGRRRPVELLAERGVLGPAFVAVHATHLRPHEVRLLGAARSFACVCRTTERDLGDGAPPLGPLLDAGARLCVGVDSHALGDPFEELRAVELDERVRTEARTVACDGAGLLAAGSAEGYAAIGFEGAEGADRVELDAADPSLAGLGGADAATWADGVIFGASGRAVRRVEVAGEAIVEGGVPRGGSAARRAFEAAVAAIA